jgi:hypothetical protein
VLVVVLWMMLLLVMLVVMLLLVMVLVLLLVLLLLAPVLQVSEIHPFIDIFLVHMMATDDSLVLAGARIHLI